MKLCDEYLRAVASEADEDEATFGETDHEPGRLTASAG
jgi:hypothetical protein